MNLRNILSEIEQTDPQAYEQHTSRRNALKNIGAKMALAAVPAALVSLLPKKAEAKIAASGTVTDALNFALEYSYFLYNFYHTANSTGGLIPSSSTSNVIGVNDTPGFLRIETNEKNHIIFLNTAISSLGGTPYTPPGYNSTDLNPLYVPTAYDFTAGGKYMVFNDTNYWLFLDIAQVFEDAYIRALNSLMPAVQSNTTVLTQFMQMLATEGRHTSHVRMVRRYTGAPESPAPWITNDISPATDFQVIYNGEKNTVQLGGIDISTLPDNLSAEGVVPLISASAGFDEPLDTTTVLNFIKPFMVS